MTMTRRISSLLIGACAMATATSAPAQPRDAQSSAPAPRPAASQGIAVLATGATEGPTSTRDEAFGLARAVYGSALRPRNLDEVRARILAGDPPAASASKDARELGELRTSIAGDDAASRRLLASIGQQMHVQALLVVRRTAPTPEASPRAAGDTDADGGVPAAAPSAARVEERSVVARLFVLDTQDFDAARYEPEPSSATPWRGTVASLLSRFPVASPPVTAEVKAPASSPPTLSSESKDSKPFYLSPWLWGAVGAAAFLGGFFYFASQDNSSDPIHLQMHVPR